MATNFTQKISMDCTKEQYEKYLKEELLKMGYKEDNVSWWDDDDNKYITNYYSANGKFGNINRGDLSADDTRYLGSFNPELFLALAAMTDSERIFGYREWAKQKNGNDFQLPLKGENCNPYWRKATKEEIMTKFGKDKTVSTIIAIDITTNSDKKRCCYGSEKQIIAILKSKGYRILKPTAWEKV